MPLLEARQVKRPRLALNCVTCRRRKVRCGKEQPQCRNCERLGETCVYNIGTRDPTTGRVVRATEEEERSEPPPSNDAVIPPPRNPESSRQGGQDVALVQQQVPRDELPLPPDHEFVQRGSLSRLIGKSFWGFVNGQEKLNDAFFCDKHDDPPDLPPSYISFVSMTKTLFALPNKPVCEVLLHSFMVGVHPIHPVVDEMAFRSKWDEFWEWCGEDVLHTPTRLIQDPTFICLLFAVLFAGASAASESTWEIRTLQDLDRGETISQLRTACSEMLAACRHTEHPTLDTLSASILLHHFTKHESLQKALSVSTIIRLAQSMGLQQENIPAGLDASQDHWRQLWRHIVWLDIQTSLTSGLPAHYGGDILESSGTSDNLPDNVSVITLHATGQYEAAKIQGQIIRHLQGARAISQDTIAQLRASTKQLHDLIDNLIAKIPMHAFREKEMVPSFANISPESHPSLYKDQASEPSVLGAWARIMLSLVKLEVTISLQKAFLEPPDSIEHQTSWEEVARLCLNYLQIHLHLHMPAFKPYAWFFSQYHAPRQCVLLILLYLIHRRQSDAENDPVMVFYVDEGMDFIASKQHPVFDSGGSRSDSELALNVLVRLRKQLDELSNAGGKNASTSNQTTGNTVVAEDHDHLADGLGFGDGSFSRMDETG